MFRHIVFKDEVRVVGKALGLPDNMVYRQPFPGPGLGVRCVGAITRDRLEAVRESDAILREEFAKAGLDKTVWQYFTVVPPITSTGVRDGKRVDAWPVVIRAVNTIDAMTATVATPDSDFVRCNRNVNVPFSTSWRLLPELYSLIGYYAVSGRNRFQQSKWKHAVHCLYRCGSMPES